MSILFLLLMNLLFSFLRTAKVKSRNYCMSLNLSAVEHLYPGDLKDIRVSSSSFHMIQALLCIVWDKLLSKIFSLYQYYISCLSH